MANRVKQRPTRSQIWARVFLSGPSGAGKTRGAFELASRLMGGDLPIALANTEPNRGELYADRFPIEALIDIEGDYNPERFIEAIDSAEELCSGGVLILDSATHEWYGTNGITQLASRFGDWAKARPLHQKFVDRLQIAQMHVIVCCRAKMKYEQVEVEQANGTKKQTVIALGVGPMQDADFQYEFSLAGQIDRASHEVEWTGHVDALEGQTTTLVGEDADRVAAVLSKWLSEGDPIVPPETAAEEDVARLRELLAATGVSDEDVEKGLAVARRQNRGQLHPEFVAGKIAAAEEKLAKATPAAAEPPQQEALAPA